MSRVAAVYDIEKDGAETSSVRFKVQCDWMLRLVEPYVSSAGKADFSDRAPSGLLHLRALHALRSECQYLGLQIVTHEIEFAPVTLAIGMHRQFCRRQSEDQPSMTRVHGRKSEDVPHEGAISPHVLAEYDQMRTKDHAGSLSGKRNQRKTIICVPVGG